jgi:hypothetical protein
VNLPGDRTSILSASGLKPEEVYSPEGKDIAWDPSRHVAVSDAYNTLAFATPLVELPISRVTQLEQQSYERFRLEYLNLWRRYFDPIGMRISLRDNQVRLDTYILPLIQSSTYNVLRQQIGGGTTRLDPGSIPSKSMVQFTTHINPRGNRAEWTSMLSILGGKVSLDFLGDWCLFRLDDSPIYSKLAAAMENDGLDKDPRDAIELLFQIPLTLGIEIRDRLLLGAFLGTLRGAVLNALPGTLTWEPMDPEYKGVSIVRIQAKADKLDQLLGADAEKEKKPSFNPSIYYALIGNALYVSLREDSMKGLIDRHVERRKAKTKATESVEINSSLYLAPAAAVQAREAVRMMLGRQLAELAIQNDPLLYVLYRTGLVPAAADESQVREAARTYLGFVPVSPDGSPYTYDAKSDEVANARFGTARDPHAHVLLEMSSPLGQLLEQLRWLRADLLFREDGVQTTVTLDRTVHAK